MDQDKTDPAKRPQTLLEAAKAFVGDDWAAIAAQMVVLERNAAAKAELEYVVLRLWREVSRRKRHARYRRGREGVRPRHRGSR